MKPWFKRKYRPSPVELWRVESWGSEGREFYRSFLKIHIHEWGDAAAERANSHWQKVAAVFMSKASTGADRIALQKAAMGCLRVEMHANRCPECRRQKDHLN